MAFKDSYLSLQTVNTKISKALSSHRYYCLKQLISKTTKPTCRKLRDKLITGQLQSFDEEAIILRITDVFNYHKHVIVIIQPVQYHLSAGLCFQQTVLRAYYAVKVGRGEVAVINENKNINNNKNQFEVVRFCLHLK